MTTVLPSRLFFALGQAGGGGTGGVVVWSLVLICLLVLGFVAVSYVRKWVKDDQEPERGPGFTLGDLRRMHQKGQMTDEEFEKARSQMIAATQRTAERAAEAAREAAKQRAGSLSDIEEIRARARRVKSVGAGPQPPPDIPPATPPLPPPPSPPA